MRNIATEETDSMRKALNENFESVKTALLGELRFERRRNDSLERENDHLGNVEWRILAVLITIFSCLGSILAFFSLYGAIKLFHL